MARRSQANSRTEQVLRQVRSLLTLAGAVMMAGSVAAQTAPATGLLADQDGISYELSTGLRASDNYARTANAVSGEMASVGMALDALRRSGRLQYDGAGDVSLVHYFNGDFGNQVVGKLDFKGDYGLTPEAVHWTISEKFGQIVRDYFAAPGPQNRQYLNVVSTGPDIRLRFGAADDLKLSGRYGRDDYQSSGYSASHAGGALELEHRPAANTLLSVGASTDKVDYFQQFAQPGDFQLRKYFASYQFQGRVSTLNLLGGYADTLKGLAQLQGAIGRVDIERRLTASSLLSVGVRRDLKTVTEGSRATDYVPGAAGFSTAAILTGSLFFSEIAELGFIHRRPRTTYSAWLDYVRETDHRDIRPDRDAKSIASRITHKLTPLSELSLSATWTRELLKNAIIPNFPVGNYSSTESALALTLRRRLTHVMFVAVDVTRSKRAATIQPFVENAVWVRLAYSPHLINLAGRYNQ